MFFWGWGEIALDGFQTKDLGVGHSALGVWGFIFQTVLLEDECVVEKDVAYKSEVFTFKSFIGV